MLYTELKRKNRGIHCLDNEKEIRMDFDNILNVIRYLRIMESGSIGVLPVSRYCGKKNVNVTFPSAQVDFRRFKVLRESAMTARLPARGKRRSFSRLGTCIAFRIRSVDAVARYFRFFDRFRPTLIDWTEVCPINPERRSLSRSADPALNFWTG